MLSRSGRSGSASRRSRAGVAVPPPSGTTASHGRQANTRRDARAGASATVIIPYSAVIYDPSGQTYAFTNTGSAHVRRGADHGRADRGQLAYLSTGPKAGTKVVTVGAEELYGVQTGVLAQT